MPKFKKGDRVRCVESNGKIRKGMTGTILDDNSMPYVEWDNIENGWERLDLTGHRRLSVWAISEKHLELIKPEVDLTKIDKPFGLLDAETQKALKECGGPWEGFRDDCQWAELPCPSWMCHITYRKKPVSVRVKRSFEGYVTSIGTIRISDTIPQTSSSPMRPLMVKLICQPIKSQRRTYEHD